jgi:hypothetical protein
MGRIPSHIVGNRPIDGDLVANWGTLTGALCFAVAGAMQEFA